jgi:DNA (cytosine-5)-methyltransferase 1
MVGHHPDTPLSTIVQKGCTQAVVSAGLLNLKGSDRRMSDVEEPSPAVTSQGNHLGEVRAFLMKYYGTDQAPEIDAPLDVVTTKDRFGIVTVEGEPYVITDIGMRMLTPRELFKAQGFPADYEIETGLFEDGERRPLTKTAQVRMCGNSVCPPIAAALVAANCNDLAIANREAAE